jgi:hypothetical protein
MSDLKEQLAGLLRWGPHPPYQPDPAVLLEAVLREVDSEDQKRIAGLYFDAVAATLQANLKFVQGVQAIVTGQQG